MEHPFPTRTGTSFTRTFNSFSRAHSRRVGMTLVGLVQYLLDTYFPQPSVLLRLSGGSSDGDPLPSQSLEPFFVFPGSSLGTTQSSIAYGLSGTHTGSPMNNPSTINFHSKFPPCTQPLKSDSKLCLQPSLAANTVQLQDGEGDRKNGVRRTLASPLIVVRP